MNLLLRSVSKRSGANFPEIFPFNVPVIRALDTLEFTQPVTILVGDNGSGKSTLLEGIAAAARLPAAGADRLEADPTLAAARQLGDALKLVWSKRSGRGFFLRAEDFFGFARRMARLRQEFEQDLADLDGEYAERSDYARGLAGMPYQRELYEMQRDLWRKPGRLLPRGELPGLLPGALQAGQPDPAGRAGSAALAPAPACLAGPAQGHGEPGRAVHPGDPLPDPHGLSGRGHPQLRRRRDPARQLRGPGARPPDARLPQRSRSIPAAPLEANRQDARVAKKAKPLCLSLAFLASWRFNWFFCICPPAPIRLCFPA